MTASGEASTKQVSEAIREKFGEEWTVDEAWQVIAARAEHRHSSKPAQVGRNL